MRPRSARFGLSVLAAIVVAGGLAGGVGRASSARQTLDRQRLEIVENLSESLANDLLALSIAVRDKDRPGIVRHFPEMLHGSGLPNHPTPEQPRLKWISDHGWEGVGHPAGGTADASSRPLSRERFLGSLEAVLDHFVSIEDARFKVKEAEFELEDLLDAHAIPDRDPQQALIRGTARVSFFVIGRDPDGRREWLRGWARIEAARYGVPEPAGALDTSDADGTDASDPTDEPLWQVDHFELESMDSVVANAELFSEIAIPAGVHATFPDFGTAPNDTVVAHGVAVADVDNDGLLDVATTGVVSNRLYLNDGLGGFRDASAETYVDLSPPGSGPLFVDVDNDGDSDLFMAAIGTQILLENRLVPDGEAVFVDRSLESGVAVDAIGFGAAAADVNGDGWQDIYVASYNRYGLVMPDAWDQASNGTPNLLFINQGDGSFRERAAEWGVRETRWSYAAGFADVDADGRPDLYVANDFGENGLYLNNGLRFREAAEERGVLDPGNGMGVAYGDYDNDGDLDLHVTNMSSTAGNRILSRLYPDADPSDLVLKKLAAGNSLYANDGAGSFVDVTHEVGGISAGWAFGGGFLDFDNDGWEDIYSPNGFISGKTMKDT